MITFKEGCYKLYYTQHTLLSNMGQLLLLLLLFFLGRNKYTHIQDREKGVLTQRHTTTLFKSYGNFYGNVMKLINLV